MSGHWQEFDWHGRVARAWMPAPLASCDFEFDARTIRAAEQATAALALGDADWPTNWEPLARLLLRTEGIASSSIEGVMAPLADIALAEVALSAGPAGWVADNLSAAAKALTHDGPLTAQHLHAWHEQLMSHSTLTPSMIGAFRIAPSWIGGTSPLDAAFVPPVADTVPELMDLLIDYANHDHFDPVTQAGLVHAQFETIHPYGDGNGRLGRILIGWLLRRRGVIARLPPPISVLIGRDHGGYISGLHLFREGPVGPYVRWFAGVAQAAATHSAAMVETVTATLAEWEAQLTDLRADAAARRLISMLPETPVVTAPLVAELLGVSEPSARTALKVLADRNILVAIEAPSGVRQPGRTPRYFAATQLLDATAAWAG